MVDGFGHAIVAGGGQMTFIDYSVTRDITSALNPVFQLSGYTNIDDVRGDFTQGGAAPEPGSMLLMGSAVLLGLAGFRRARG